jgi:rhamnosyltransferase
VTTTRAGVTLLLPTWNAGPEFPDILDLMRRQRLDRSLEIVVIDSGSTDGTAEYLRKQPFVRLIEIPNREFNHGLTRERGIREATGDIVVLATQDARPADDQWMQRLVDCFADPRVAGAYSRQAPRSDANPFIRDRLGNWVAASATPREQSVASQAEFDALAPLEKLSRSAFDNVSSAVRRSVALEIPFRERRFGEDLDWGHRVLLAGYKIIFEPRSCVIHSHNNSIWYEMKRVYLDHQNLHRLFGVHTIPRLRDVAVCTIGGTRHMARVVNRDPGLTSLGRLKWWSRVVPYVFTQNLAQFLGARSASPGKQNSLVYQWVTRRLASKL